MEYPVQLVQVSAQPISVIAGTAKRSELPKKIRELFDRYYAANKSKGELNIVYYPGCLPNGDLEIACGVQSAQGGNAETPAGFVATTTYIGPYDRMRPAHEAIHLWARGNNRTLAGPSWEVYGHWNDDPSLLRTDIFYLLS